MKHVLLLGDSIRIGYDKSVCKSLEGIASVHFPEENCRFAAYLLRYLHEHIEAVGCEPDVIHWNAGLWDCLRLLQEDPHTPIPVYQYYLDRLCSRIRKLCPNATVIFATSTSVLSEKMDINFKRYNEEIAEYNRAALEVVEKYGFAINDLYAVSVSLPEEAHSDPVHYYTSLGTEAFAKQVLSCIAPALGLTKIPEYQEVIHIKAPVGI